MDLSFNKNTFLTSLMSFSDCEATFSSESPSNNEAGSHPPLLSAEVYGYFLQKKPMESTALLKCECFS